VISCYAIFHLLRPAKARTPLSSASYHIFALVMDVGLIPFMVITAFFSQKNWALDSKSDARWHSFFNLSGTNTVLLVTWIAAIAIGALHLFSIGIDIYLIIIFRKIANYPPDSNPLEDNLTSRAASKHAYKNSDMTVSVSEKKYANMSGSTVNVNRPLSQPLMTDKYEAGTRPISFYQSRKNLDQSYSAHTQDTARMSRADLAGTLSSRTSRADLNSRGGRVHSRPGSAHSRSQSRSRSRPRSQGGAGNRASYLSAHSVHDPMPTRPLSLVSTSAGNSGYASPLPGPQAHLPADMAKMQQKNGLLNDNWYAFPDADEGDLSSPRRTPQPSQAVHDYSEHEEDEHTRTDHNMAMNQEHENLLPQSSSAKASSGSPTHSNQSHPSNNEYTTGDDSIDGGAFYFSDMPTATPTLDKYGNSHESSLTKQSYLNNTKTHSYDNVHANYNDVPDDSTDANSARNSQGTIGRALTVSSAISAVSSFYSQGSSVDANRAPSPKRRAYGDLASATAGVLGQSGSQSQLTIPKQSSTRAKSHSRERREAEGRPLQRGHVEKGGRVVSRTGVDLAELYLGDSTPSPSAAQRSGLRGRQVSGKVVEEGRAGPEAGWFGRGVGNRMKEVSGSA